MKEFIINDLTTWMQQNDADIIDVREGCLLDNYFCTTKNGVVCIREFYVNSNMSEYHAYFARDKKPSAIVEVTNKWLTFIEAYDNN